MNAAFTLWCFKRSCTNVHSGPDRPPVVRAICDIKAVKGRESDLMICYFKIRDWLFLIYLNIMGVDSKMDFWILTCDISFTIHPFSSTYLGWGCSGNRRAGYSRCLFPQQHNNMSSAKSRDAVVRTVSQYGCTYLCISQTEPGTRGNPGRVLQPVETCLTLCWGYGHSSGFVYIGASFFFSKWEPLTTVCHSKGSAPPSAQHWKVNQDSPTVFLRDHKY